MSINWFERVAMTPERQAVYEAMEAADEGLGPRAYRTLLLVGDGQPTALDDVLWLLADEIAPPLVEFKLDEYCRLSARGRAIYDAANRGDHVAIFGLTTLPHLRTAGLN